VDLKTVAWNGVADEGSQPLDDIRESGWRAFLGSLKFGAVLVVTCVLGLVAIVSANPFAAAGVSERVSARLGQPSVCTQVGATRVAGVNSTIYRCTVGVDIHAKCFVVSGSDIKQLGGNRELGC
jgi:hypothetical protein